MTDVGLSPGRRRLPTLIMSVVIALVCAGCGATTDGVRESIRQSRDLPPEVAQCLDLVVSKMETPDLRRFGQEPEEYLVGKYHLTLGMDIREICRLRKDNEVVRYFQRKGLSEPDGMSEVVMVTLHRLIRGQRPDVEGAIRAEADRY